MFKQYEVKIKHNEITNEINAKDAQRKKSTTNEIKHLMTWRTNEVKIEHNKISDNSKAKDDVKNKAKRSKVNNRHKQLESPKI